MLTYMDYCKRIVLIATLTAGVQIVAPGIAHAAAQGNAALRFSASSDRSETFDNNLFSQPPQLLADGAIGEIDGYEPPDTGGPGKSGGSGTR